MRAVQIPFGTIGNKVGDLVWVVNDNAQTGAAVMYKYAGCVILDDRKKLVPFSHLCQYGELVSGQHGVKLQKAAAPATMSNCLGRAKTRGDGCNGCSIGYAT